MTKATVYGLIWDPSDSQNQCRTALHKGKQYNAAIEATGGITGSICDNDYTSTLSKISHGMSEQLRASFPLSHQPVANIVVTVNGQVQSGNYSIEGRSLVFTRAPESGSTISIKYDYLRSDMKEFILEEGVDAGSIKAFVGGNELPRNSYQYIARENKVRFSSTPVGSTLEIRYFLSKQRKNFSLSKPAMEDSISITIDGNNIDSTLYDYIAEDNSIKFVNPPHDGANIIVNYMQALGKNGEYALNFPLNEQYIDTLKVTDEATNRAVLYSLKEDNSKLVFADDQIVEGRVIVVEYENGVKDFSQVPVKNNVHSVTSVIAKNSNGEKECAVQNVTFNGANLDLSSCGFSDGDVVAVDYRYVSGFNNKFTIEDDRLELSSGRRLIWTVKVNDEETQDYHVDGKTVTLDNIEEGDVVAIEVKFYPL